LEELLKYTDQEEEDYQNIKDALQKIQREVDQINSNKAGTENLRKLLEIYNNLEGSPKVHIPLQPVIIVPRIGNFWKTVVCSSERALLSKSRKEKNRSAISFYLTTVCSTQNLGQSLALIRSGGSSIWIKCITRRMCRITRM
jgi:hypothetical protein